MKIGRESPVWDAAWLLSLFVSIVAFSYPYFFHSATDSIRQIQSYNLDSADALRAVEAGLRAPRFQLTFNDYGHFYYNITMGVVSLYSILGTVSEWLIFFVLRMNALIGGCLSILITYIFAKRYMVRTTAIIASGLMALSPALLQYSNEAKPDSWQVFFLMLSIYFLARAWEASNLSSPWPYIPTARLQFVTAASAAAGAAFGTKYLGMFMLPLIGVALLGVSTDQVSDRLAERFKRGVFILSLPVALLFAVLAAMGTPERVMADFFIFPNAKGMPIFLAGLLAVRIACGFIALAFLLPVATRMLRHAPDVPDRLTKGAFAVFCVAGAFWLTFYISSPWLFSHLAFAREIFIRNSLVQSSERFGLMWLGQLFWTGTYVGYFSAILAIGGLILLAISAFRGDARINLAFLPVVGFMVIFLLLLIMKVNRATVLYGLPIIPLLALLASFFVWKTATYIGNLFRMRAATITAILGVALLVEQTLESQARLLAYPNLVTQVSPDSQHLSAWLLKCVPFNNRVLAGSYSYVPTEFKAVVMGDSYLYFARINPSVVTVNMKSKAIDEADARRLSLRMDPDREKLYQMLADSSHWSIGPSFGIFQIYLRRGIPLNLGCP